MLLLPSWTLQYTLPAEHIFVQRRLPLSNTQTVPALLTAEFLESVMIITYSRHPVISSRMNKFTKVEHKDIEEQRHFAKETFKTGVKS